MFCDDLIYQPNYRTQECAITLSAAVKRGQLIYVTSAGAFSETATSNSVYGVALNDYEATAPSIALLVEGEVFGAKLDAVKGTALTAVEKVALRNIGIIVK